MPDITITRGAAHLLASALSQGGWYAEKDQTAHVYRAGQILDFAAMDVGEMPKTDNAIAAKAWNDSTISVTLTEKQRDTAKACVSFFINKAALPAGAPLMSLMRALGLAPED